MHIYLNDLVFNGFHGVYAAEKKIGNTFKVDVRIQFTPTTKLIDQLDQTMPEIFPESSPGSFTYVPELNKWVMTVFHHYQWDLNFSNPNVLVAMTASIEKAREDVWNRMVKE